MEGSPSPFDEYIEWQTNFVILDDGSIWRWHLETNLLSICAFHCILPLVLTALGLGVVRARASRRRFQRIASDSDPDGPR
jgi:hypothetical protein